MAVFIASLIAASCALHAAEEEAPEDIPPEIPEEMNGDLLPPMPKLGSLLWDSNVSLRTWGGYSDNPSLSPLNAKGSAFIAGGGDLLVYRLPIDGREVSFFGMLEHVAYVEGGLAPETIGILDVRYAQTWESGWGISAAFEYAYLNQVFDASDLEGIPFVVRAEGHNLSLKPGVSRTVGKNWRIEMELDASRQWLANPLDSFWDAGPEIGVRRTLPHEGEAGFSYRFRNRGFDSRPPRDENGLPLDGTLSFEQHEFETFWRQRWGSENRWRSTVRGGFLWSDDNGGGFYDYYRYNLDLSLYYVTRRWEIRADARFRWYIYPTQPAEFVGGAHRRRSDITLTARGEWIVRKGIRAFLEYSIESSEENGPAADYDKRTVSCGMALEM